MSALDVRFDDTLSDHPRERWPDLVRARRSWAWSEGYRVFQLLRRFAEEAPQLAEELGYADAATLLRHGYQLDLMLGSVDPAWLKLLRRSGASEPRERSCHFCNTLFMARRRDARYCCALCGQRSRRALRARQGAQ